MLQRLWVFRLCLATIPDSRQANGRESSTKSRPHLFRALTDEQWNFRVLNKPSPKTALFPKASHFQFAQRKLVIGRLAKIEPLHHLTRHCKGHIRDKHPGARGSRCFVFNKALLARIPPRLIGLHLAPGHRLPVGQRINARGKPAACI